MAKDHRRVDVELAQEVLLDNPDFLHEIVERVLQELLEAEMTEHVGAAPYERTERRTGQRNGYKRRTLRTRVGTLNLLVPQDREGTFSTRLFWPAWGVRSAQRGGGPAARFGAGGPVAREPSQGR